MLFLSINEENFNVFSESTHSLNVSSGLDTKHKLNQTFPIKPYQNTFFLLYPTRIRP
jgi:hypothetical protein